jgi:histidine triad (HIT) family protein
MPYRFQEGPCPVCACVEGRKPWAVLERTDHSAAYLPSKPTSPGCTLVVPLRHVVTLTELRRDEADDLWLLLRKVMAGVGRAHQASGFHISQYTGVIGEEPFAHLHWRLEPRYEERGQFVHVPFDQLPKVPLKERLKEADFVRPFL